MRIFYISIPLLLITNACIANASDPKPCFGDYCLTDTIEAFEKSIPTGVDYHYLGKASINTKAPILINGQNFQLSYSKIKFKKSEHSGLRLKYKYTPLIAGECQKRYEELLTTFQETHGPLTASIIRPEKGAVIQNGYTITGIHYATARSPGFNIYSAYANWTKHQFKIKISSTESNFDQHTTCSTTVSFLPLK